MSGVVHATMVRGFELHLGGVWLQACMERRRIAASPTNLWVGFESSCTRGQYGLTSARNLSQGKGHQCIGCCSSWKVNVAGFYVHAVSRCNRGSQPSKFLLFLSTNFYPESQTASPMHVRYDLLAGKMAH